MKDLEIIMVDDKSTDKSLKVVEKFMKYDSFSKKLINLKYVSTEGKTFFKKIIISICSI